MFWDCKWQQGISESMLNIYAQYCDQRGDPQWVGMEEKPNKGRLVTKATCWQHDIHFILFKNKIQKFMTVSTIWLSWLSKDFKVFVLFISLQCDMTTLIKMLIAGFIEPCKWVHRKCWQTVNTFRKKDYLCMLSPENVTFFSAAKSSLSCGITLLYDAYTHLILFIHQEYKLFFFLWTKAVNANFIETEWSSWGLLHALILPCDKVKCPGRLPNQVSDFKPSTFFAISINKSTTDWINNSIQSLKAMQHL